MRHTGYSTGRHFPRRTVAAHCLALMLSAIAPPAVRQLSAQQVADTASLRTSGVVHVPQPTIVAFHDPRDMRARAFAQAQAARLRSKAESLGVQWLVRSEMRFPYVTAGAIVLWSVPDGSPPQGYLFLHRGGLQHTHYGFVADTTLRRVMDEWRPARTATSASP